MNGGRGALGALSGCKSGSLKPGRTTESRQKMRSPGFSPLGMVRWPSSEHKDRTLAQFEELAMPLFPSLYNLARWLAQNSNDAEDLVQETYLKALRGFDSFEPGTNFRAWIFQILRNTFLGPVRSSNGA